MIYLLGGAVEVANGIPLVISLIGCINRDGYCIILYNTLNKSGTLAAVSLYNVKTHNCRLEFHEGAIVYVFSMEL